MTFHKLEIPGQLPVCFRGPPLSEGPLPAFLYFSLSDEESLLEHPYSTPAEKLSSFFRVFSWTLPFHGPGFNKFHAMEKWLRAFYEQKAPFEEFFRTVCAGIEWLISEKIIHPDQLAAGGLSRGAWIATHIAAREKRIKTLLGFAPLTRFQELPDYQPYLEDLSFSNYLDAWNLRSLTEQLLHLKHVRYYIGGRDRWVSTDACYRFVRELTEKGHALHARHLNVEFRMTPSVGLKGHGTTPETFSEGCQWLINQING